jgi:hypothetical protein
MNWLRRPSLPAPGPLASGDIFVHAAELSDPVRQPIEVPHAFFEDVEQQPSFFYGIFNPMGPTWT